MNSLVEDLEKQGQLNRARLTSYVTLRKEIKTYCGTYSKHGAEREEMTQRTFCAHGNGKGKHGKGKHGMSTVKGKQGQQGQQDKNKDENKYSIECWSCGKRGHYSKDCWGGWI